MAFKDTLELALFQIVQVNILVIIRHEQFITTITVAQCGNVRTFEFIAHSANMLGRNLVQRLGVLRVALRVVLDVAIVVDQRGVVPAAQGEVVIARFVKVNGIVLGAAVTVVLG